MTANPVGPRITYYDDATGERIELSTVTLVNWAAKTGNLLRDELGAGPGSRIGLLLPTHWQTAAVVFGVWYIGAEVALGAPQADVVMCTAETLAQADADEVVVLSLDPFGRPVPGLPAGITDYATSVQVQADQLSAERAPGPALKGRSADDVYDAALTSAAAQSLSRDDRVMSTMEWTTDTALVSGLVAVFASGASLVQVACADTSLLERRRESERVTRTL